MERGCKHVDETVHRRQQLQELCSRSGTRIHSKSPNLQALQSALAPLSPPKTRRSQRLSDGSSLLVIEHTHSFPNQSSSIHAANKQTKARNWKKCYFCINGHTLLALPIRARIGQLRRSCTNVVWMREWRQMIIVLSVRTWRRGWSTVRCATYRKDMREHHYRGSVNTIHLV